MRYFLLLVLGSVFQLNIYGQVGDKNMAEMNSYIVNYAASQMSPIQYNSKLGIVNQSIYGITERYKIFDIKRIEVSGKDQTFVVQFFCDEKDPCVSQIRDNQLGKYIASVSYYFTSSMIANTFALKASEIIKQDFNKEVSLNTLGSVEPIVPIKKDVVKETSIKKPPPVNVEKKKVVEDHLSLDSYTSNAGGGNGAAAQTVFGGKVMNVVEQYNSDKLEASKGPAMENAWASKLKMPKAKKNYINQFKGNNCYVAEYGTSKFIDDLEDQYYELQDELDNNLPQDWEMVDHSQDDIYADSDDDIYHIEYINQVKKEAPSITLMIVPDGKRYTLFMRVGKK